jgi:hypothetical protein
VQFVCYSTGWKIKYFIVYRYLYRQEGALST